MNGKFLMLVLSAAVSPLLIQADAPIPTAALLTYGRQVGALQSNCELGGTTETLAYQFVATCAGRAPSPDGRFAVVQKAYDDEQPPIEVRDASDRVVADLPTLSDDMPFSIAWSPDSHWFLASHHVGSFMDVLQIFEIVDSMPVERTALTEAAVRVAHDHYPCLRPDMILPNSARWTRDGRGLVIVTISRPDACSGDYGPTTGQWEPLWMIGDLATGVIDPASIRVQGIDGLLGIPEDGVYSVR